MHVAQQHDGIAANFHDGVEERILSPKACGVDAEFLEQSMGHFIHGQTTTVHENGRGKLLVNRAQKRGLSHSGGSQYRKYRSALPRLDQPVTHGALGFSKDHLFITPISPGRSAYAADVSPDALMATGATSLGVAVFGSSSYRPSPRSQTHSSP
ncbi:hypothetical protein GCM10010321_80810 [Streptomyces chartreusis]|nr:hypothetical protein GCM10010321_80810 [Streptomyces chartreusis]